MKQSSIINHQSSMFCSANGAVYTPPCNSRNFSQSIRDLIGSIAVVDTTVTTQSKVSLLGETYGRGLSIFNHQSSITRALLFLAFILLPMVGWGALTSTHTPGVYAKATKDGGYGQTLKTYSNRQYEVYGFSSTGSSANYVWAGTTTTSSSDANCVLAFETTTEKTNGWISNKVNGRGSSISNKVLDEFNQTGYSMNYRTNSTLTIKISGYDQFSIYGKDNSTTKSRTFLIKVDGNDVTSQQSTNYTVRRFDISTGEHTIEVTSTEASSSSNNELYGFSLRLPATSTYTAIFNNGGHGTAPAKQTNVSSVTLSQMADADNLENDYWTADKATKVGSTDKAAGAQLNHGETVTLLENTTFTAHWKTATDKYTVKYKDGTNDLGIETVEVGKNPTASQITTTKAHYKFESWQKDGVDIALSSVSGTKDQTITLTARYSTIYAQSVNLETEAAKSKPQAINDFFAANGYTSSIGTSGGYDATGDAGYHGYKFKNNGDWIEFIVQQGCTATVTFGYAKKWTINYGSNSETYTNDNKSYNGKQYIASSGDMLIKLTNTTSTSCIQKITISASCTSTTLGISAASTLLTLSSGTASTTLTKQSGSNTNAVVYKAYSDENCTSEASNYSVSEGTITFTAAGIYYIKGTQEEDATYCATESNRLTITVSEPTYTVTYNMKGHGTQIDPVKNVTALPDPLPTPSADGYTFGGWFTDEELTIAAIAGASITDNTTLYAKWTAKGVAYTGDIYPIGQNFTWGWTISDMPKMDNDGAGTYTWSGWMNGSSENGFKFLCQKTNDTWYPAFMSTTSGQAVSAGSTKYPIQKVEKTTDNKFMLATSGYYTITLDLTDKDNGKMTITQVPNQTVYLNLNSFTNWENDGDYGAGKPKFVVWDGQRNVDMSKVADDCSSHMYSAEVFGSATELYFKRCSQAGADWNQASGNVSATDKMMTITDWNAGTIAAHTPYYTINFDKKEKGVDIESQCVISGGKVTVPATKVLGYTCEWFDNAEYSGTAWNFATNTVSQSMTLYAKWTATSNKTVYFKPTYGESGDWRKDNADIFMHVWCGGSQADQVADYKMAAANTCDVELTASIPTNAEQVLFVRCKSGHDTPVWSGDDYWGQTNSVDYSSTYDLYTISDYSTAVAPASNFSPTTFTITFDGNGNTGGSMSDVENIACEGSATLSANGFIKAGHSFSNWKDQDNNSYDDKATISNIKSNITLTAQWEKVKTTPTITWADFADAKLGELVTFTITTTSDADLTNAITVTGGTLRSAAVSGKSITAQVACPIAAGTVTVQFVTAATEDYTATDMSKNITVKACSMTEYVIPVKSECTNRGSSVTPRYVWNTENVGLLTRAFGGSSTGSTSITSYGGSSYRTSSNSTQWMFQSSMDDVTKVRFYLYCNNDAVSFSNYYQSEEYFSSVSDKIKQSVTATLSNGGSTFSKGTNGYIDIPLAKEMNTGDFGMFVVSNNVYAISVGLFTEKPTEPTLTWSDKQTSAIEITYDPSAATHTINLSAVANSIGDITYGIKTNTDGLISSYADGVITLNAVAGSAEVQVTVAEAGCYSEKTITRTITQSLPTISKPTVSIATDGSQTVCSVDVEDLGTITATPACETADAEFTYQWFKGGELISDATANTYKPSAAGIYTCKVTAAKTGYTSAISDASNELTYTVNETPSPTISGENGVALNTDLPLTATAYDGATYQWYSCDDDQKSNPVLIDGATTNVYTVNRPVIGTYYYYCLVTSANNCPAETSVKTITVSSMTAITLSQPDATTKGTEAVNAYYDAAMPEITVPERTGYSFLGYFDAESEGKQYYTATGASAANWDKEDATATLHAQWSINSYNLTWTLNGGEITTPGTEAGLVEYNTVVTAPTVARTGYQFGGWEPEVVSPMPASDKEYIAQWTANQYAITYKDQGNKDFSGVHGASYPQTHTYGTSTTLVNPTKAAFDFDGWYTSADCTTGKVTTLGATDYTAAITLYAKWNTKVVYDDYIYKKQASATGCVENPDVAANANQAQTNLNYSSAAITGASSMDRPSTKDTEFRLTYTPATGYAITSICTYGKLEESKGAQISWDGGETWTDVAQYTSEQQKEFSSPDVEGSLSFIIKYTLETAGSGGLYWRNARVNMKTHVPMTDPVLTLSENEAEIAIPSYLQSGSTTVMLSGKNLGDYNGEYSVTAPEVDGLTISPTTFTVANGKVAQEFTITFSTTQDEVAENDVDFVFAIPNSGLSQTLNLTYSKAHGVQQTDVTGSTTWNWNNAATENIKLTDAKNVELVLANVPGVTNNATFNSQALKFYGENVYNKPKDKDAYASVGHIKFNTTVQGRVSVTFASNNSSNSRCVAINGEKSAITKGTFITFTALVDKGEVVVMGYEGSTENAYLQIRKIVFEAVDHYRENLTIGNIGSVCWPYEVAPEDRYGAEFFEISCQTQEYDEAKGKVLPYKVYFDLVEGNLEAGKPYIFIPTETKIMLFNSNDEAATAPANYNGFFGTFSDVKDDAKGTAGNVLEGNYIVYNNTFKLCGGKCSMNAYRAYLNLVKDGAEKVPVKGAAEVQNSPKRRVVITGNGFEYLEPNPNPLVTEIGQVEGETNLDEPQKLLIDNQVVIIRGGKMFNAQGALLK